MRPLLIALLLPALLDADEFRFDNAGAWNTWDMPHGLVRFGADGQLQLVKYRKDINAVANAAQFGRRLGRRHQPGGGQPRHRRRSGNLLAG